MLEENGRNQSDYGNSDSDASCIYLLNTTGIRSNSQAAANDDKNLLKFHHSISILISVTRRTRAN